MAEEAQKDRSEDGQRHAHAIVIYLVALLVTLPLFMLVHPYVPRLVLPIGTGIRLDTFLTFGVVLMACILLARRLQVVVFALLVVGVGVLTVTGMMGKYGFKDLYRDYAQVLVSLRSNTEALPLFNVPEAPFANADVLLEKLDSTSPTVRSFAVRAATTWFEEVQVPDSDMVMVQAFSVFKVINSRWKYVSDVKGGEYFATASESSELLAGDCDDHAILMAASIKAIGGEMRLVRTVGHIYPELKIGDAARMDRAAYLIREVLFKDAARHATLYYHTDEAGQRWINLDYTRHYPGGEVMDETIKGILDI